MDKKEVLVIEDEPGVRLSLCDGLKARGFKVYGAGTVAEARKLAEEHWEELAVMVLDMDLADPEAKDTTGADIGIEMRRKRWHTSSPEFIIYSRFEKPDYYRLAGKLRAVAYLKRTEYSDFDLYRHVKVLALSRALSSETAAMTNEINRIAAHSANTSEAILKFCQNILKPETENCLRHTPFVILLSDEKRTRNCAPEAAGLPEECDSLYPQLQDYVFGRKNMSDPFVFEAEQFTSKAAQLDVPPDPQTAELVKKFDLAAFVPLLTFQDFRLSIGILQEKEAEDAPVPEDAKALGAVMAEYLKPKALENMLKILPRLAELNAIRSNTAKLCLFIGQEMKNLLPVPNYDEVSWEVDSLKQLWDLADDLNDTGQLLRELGDESEGEMEPVSIEKVARTAWGLITSGEEDAEKEFKAEGDCIVVADSRDIEIAVSRLLHWLAQRRAATPPGKEPLVTVRSLEDDARQPTIIFEDRSERLNEKLRREMFATFSQAVPVPIPSESAAAESLPAASETRKEKGEGKPEGLYLPLYLAKMLVEGRYHGTLEDHSDDADMRDRSYGHRIVMQFPPNPQSV